MRNYILSFMICALVSSSLASAAGYKDKSGPDWASVKRSFKISVDDCKKSWEVSAEAGGSFCAVNSDSAGTADDSAAIVESDEIKFTCSVKEEGVTKQVHLEIAPHGTFGYLVQADGQILFASLESFLNDKIKSLPSTEISVTFVKNRAKK